jgi:N-acetylglucosamine transport system permease protein
MNFRPGSCTRDLYRPTSLIIAFLTPTLLLYGLFFVYPMAQSLFLSLKKGGAASEHFAFVGFANFSRLLADKVFWSSLKHNAQILFVGGILTLLVAFVMAVALTECRRGRTFFRTVFLFPNVMTIVAVTILWSFVFNPAFGILNSILKLTGLGDLRHAWLNEPHTAIWAITTIHIWSTVGFYIVLLYAGLLRIPAELSEAAKVDGATRLQELLHIKIPLLSEIWKIAVIYIGINALNVFGLVFLVNEGTPNRYSDVLLTYLYETAFTYNQYGYACAVGVALLFLVVGFSILANFAFRRSGGELE